jgi:UDP-sulfoquinovose synthase
LKKNVLILGVDGYLGWSVARALIGRGHVVMGIDDGRRRRGYGVKSDAFRVFDYNATPIALLDQRKRELTSYHRVWSVDVTEPGVVAHAIDAFSPDFVIHLADQTSRSFAMTTYRGASYTIRNNLLGLMETIEAILTQKFATQLVKVSTISLRERVRDYCTLTLGTQSSMIRIAAETWGLRAHEILAGLVWGEGEASDPVWLTRLDYDAKFGNVVHRFSAQAAFGIPLTIYGEGDQVIPLAHLETITKAIADVVDEPAIGKGVVKRSSVVTEQLSVSEIATTVVGAAYARSIPVTWAYVPNPRGPETRKPIELKERNLGVDGVRLTVEAAGKLIDTFLANRGRVSTAKLKEWTSWRT